MRCERCAGDGLTKGGRDQFGRQLWRCTGRGFSRLIVGVPPRLRSATAWTGPAAML